MNTERTKIFFNVRFTEPTKDAKLVSIGLLSEGTEYFYAEFNDFDKELFKDDEYVKKLFLDKLTLNAEDNLLINKSYAGFDKTEVIKDYLKKWLSQFDKIELYFDFRNFISFYNSCDPLSLIKKIFEKDGAELHNNILFPPNDIRVVFTTTGIDSNIDLKNFLNYSEDIDNVENIISSNVSNTINDAYVIRSCYNKLTKIN